MKVAVLIVDGRVSCVAPSGLALMDAVYPIQIPGWVDPCRWQQRQILGEALFGGYVSFQPRRDVPARRLLAHWQDAPEVLGDG